MTDPRVAEDALLRAVRRLPRGSGIVLRHYHLPDGERRALFDRLRRIADRRGLILFLGGGTREARAWGADGCHGDRGSTPLRWPASMAVHDARQLRVAQRRGASLIFLSPLFATRSHPGQRPLGPVRFAALARRAGVPVLALGGVKPRHGRLIRALGAQGFGAIDSLSRREVAS
ncbi:MAG: thiamine phosphate synthase [Sphingobium sp.]